VLRRFRRTNDPGSGYDGEAQVERNRKVLGDQIMPVIATAGWTVPKTVADSFAADGSSLSRYASVFDGVEINSTFYRRHKPATFERWAQAVPDRFRFAVKISKDITHARRLQDIDAPFRIFLDDIAPLGEKLGPLLCQLPPSLAFDAGVVEKALEMMRSAHDGMLVLEARHRSWAEEEATRMLERFRVDRVLADPAPVWTIGDFSCPPAYIRLHGAPRIYYSSYAPEEISKFGSLLAADSWCVFDNTASGAAIENALAMRERAS
jgi:uncharacterized protein YecE (DUF72 family)